MKREIMTVLASAILVLSACAAKSTWTSNPIRQHQENDAYEVTLEPIRQESAFFVGFKIVVKNKTDKTLEIDWNKTQYMYAGKPSGVFIFRGIDPAMLKNKTVPPDIIPPKGILSKEIAPVTTVAWTPLKESSPSGKSLINPGILPNGRNGVLLAASLQGKEIPQQVTVDIIEEMTK